MTRRAHRVLKQAVGRAKVGRTDKLDAIRQLDQIARRVENAQEPTVDFGRYLAQERDDSDQYGGRTVFDDNRTRTPCKRPSGDPRQPLLFDPENLP